MFVFDHTRQSKIWVLMYSPQSLSEFVNETRTWLFVIAHKLRSGARLMTAFTVLYIGALATGAKFAAVIFPVL
jgi:hypothetical protein